MHTFPLCGVPLSNAVEAIVQGLQRRDEVGGVHDPWAHEERLRQDVQRHSLPKTFFCAVKENSLSDLTQEGLHQLIQDFKQRNRLQYVDLAEAKWSTKLK